MGDSWYTGSDVIVDNGIVYKRLPKSYYSLENPPPRDFLEKTLFKYDLDEYYKVKYFDSNDQAFSFWLTFTPYRINVIPITTDETGFPSVNLSHHEWAKFAAGNEIQPLIFVPEDLYDFVVVSDFGTSKPKSLMSLALSKFKELRVSDFKDTEELRSILGNNIWVRTTNLPINLAAKAKLIHSDRYGPFFLAEFKSDWRMIGKEQAETTKKVCIFGMDESKINDYKEKHPGVNYIKNEDVAILNASDFQKSHLRLQTLQYTDHASHE